MSKFTRGQRVRITGPLTYQNGTQTLDEPHLLNALVTVLDPKIDSEGDIDIEDDAGDSWYISASSLTAYHVDHPGWIVEAARGRKETLLAELSELETYL